MNKGAGTAMFVTALSCVVAITINVPIDVENGHIPQDSHSQLVRLSKTLFAK